MRAGLLDLLCCPACRGTELALCPTADDGREVRAGRVECRACGRAYPIRDGVLDLLYAPSPVVQQEREAVHRLDVQGYGGAPDPARVEREQQAFLSLPNGLDHPMFREPGFWRNVYDVGPAFYELLALLRLPVGARVLEVGADTCWATYRLSQRGYDCVALDITDHVHNADLFLARAGVYFERVIADMNDLPFRADAFDLVLAVEAMHHTGDLGTTLRGCRRVLRPGGRVAAFNEPIMFIENEATRSFGQAERELGINEHMYRLEEWLKVVRQADLRPAVVPLLDGLWRRVRATGWPSGQRERTTLIVARLLHPWARPVLSAEWVARQLGIVPDARICILGSRSDGLARWLPRWLPRRL